MTGELPLWIVGAYIPLWIIAAVIGWWLRGHWEAARQRRGR